MTTCQHNSDIMVFWAGFHHPCDGGGSCNVSDKYEVGWFVGSGPANKARLDLDNPSPNLSSETVTGSLFVDISALLRLCKQFHVHFNLDASGPQITAALWLSARDQGRSFSIALLKLLLTARVD